MVFRVPNERERAWLMMIPCACLYLALQYVATPDKALLISMIIFVFYAIIDNMWERRAEPYFWTTLSFFAIIHIIFLYLIDLPHYRGPTIFFALPFMLVDGFLMWWIIRFIDRLRH